MNTLEPTMCNFAHKPTQMAYRTSPFFVLSMVLLACGHQQPTNNFSDQPLHAWVNPFIGTGGHGHTYPGATLPFGMVQLSPDTRLDGWDGCSGYHYSDSLIYGFSHTHLQGTGVSDYGDLLFMPTNNEVNVGNNWGERYRSRFQKASERAHAGYYAVHLDDHNLTAELTATTRVGIHRYLFDHPDSCVLFIDVDHRDELISYQLEPVGDSVIVGFRRSRGWAEDQRIYFAAHFSKPFEFLDQTYELYDELDPLTGAVTQVMADVPVFPLKFGLTDTLMVKVALSSTSIEGALLNMNVEAPHWDFSRYRADAETTWDQALKRIEIDTDNARDKTTFYSALYHTLTVPNTWSDVDGRYLSMDGMVHEPHREGAHAYTVFSLWDTFRATHPLFTLIERERSRDFISTMLNMYTQTGALPVWELAANETGCMIGYHSVSVIVDGFMKGIRDFDHELALEAMMATATADELGKKPFAEIGYIPSEIEHESVSKTLEYAYNDWCIARFAEAIGAGEEIVAEFNRRSLAYRNLFHPETGFLQPRRGGSFLEHFDPTEVNFNYTEANGWQYNFFVPHDINGHIDLLGGDAPYGNRLDEMFTSDAGLSGRDQADITGLIGQYAHGNEPSHHMAYLYNFIGQPHKTQERVKQILDELYSDEPHGLAGNEDCGQMSAWYVLSALGFYPVTPGSQDYLIGTPRFNARIHLENGRTITIKLDRDTPDAFYVKSITVNGEPYTKSFFTHDLLMKGGEYVFNLTKEPTNGVGVSLRDRPTSRITEPSFVPVPAVVAPRTFRVEQTVELVVADPSAEIYYRTGQTADEPFTVYQQPFVVTDDCLIEVYAKRDGLNSATVQSPITKRDPSRSVVITPLFDHQYAAGGNEALIDGIRGGPNFKTGEWQGYYGTDVTATIDLGSAKSVSGFRIGALQDIKPWIWLPRSVAFSVSTDGKTFIHAATVNATVDPQDETVQVFHFSAESAHNAVRYVRAEITHFGTIPSWHLGAGNSSWMFLDEFEVFLTP